MPLAWPPDSLTIAAEQRLNHSNNSELEDTRMSFEGNWDIVLNTPMGAQNGKMKTTVNGSELTGEITSPIGIIVIEEGKVDGNNATWFCKLTKPMNIKLGFNVNVDGDVLSGTVKVGPMGENAFEGKRAA